jgi:hypothetical protein
MLASTTVIRWHATVTFVSNDSKWSAAALTSRRSAAEMAAASADACADDAAA